MNIFTKQIKSQIDILKNLETEDFFIATYDENKKLTSASFIGEERTNQLCTIDIRNIARAIVNNDCTYVLVMHNHPNEGANPSAFDIDLTQRILDVCNDLAATFVDHIIVSPDYKEFSFDKSGVSFPVSDNKKLEQDLAIAYLSANDGEIFKSYCDKHGYKLTKKKED